MFQSSVWTSYFVKSILQIQIYVDGMLCVYSKLIGERLLSRGKKKRGGGYFLMGLNGMLLIIMYCSIWAATLLKGRSLDCYACTGLAHLPKKALGQNRSSKAQKWCSFAFRISIIKSAHKTTKVKETTLHAHVSRVTTDACGVVPIPKSQWGEAWN